MFHQLAACLLLTATVLAQTNFPPPPVPPVNPITPNKVLLGMALFFEEQMSSTGTVACATCHDLQRGGVDSRTAAAVHPGPDGIFATADDIHGSPGVPAHHASGAMTGHAAHGLSAQVTPRRAPTVINSGYHTHLGVDGSKTRLEEWIVGPPVNSVEMGFAGRTWTDVETAIAAARPLVLASDLPASLANFIAGRSYPDLFQLAYGSPVVTRDRIVRALASYLRTLNSDQSRWDLAQAGLVQLTQLELNGLAVFTSSAQGAISCHTCHGDFEPRVQNEGPIAGQMTMVPTGHYGSPIPVRLLFHNVGIRPALEDPGRYNVTQQPIDQGRFRVASLRNVELTAPYFHNGSAATLRDVVEFYNRGGDFPAHQSPGLTPRLYGNHQKNALIAILKTLTDPRVAAGVAPFEQPTLGSQNRRLAVAYGSGMTVTGGTLTANAPYAPILGNARFRVTLSGSTPGIFTLLLWDVAPNEGPMPFLIGLAGSPAMQWFAMGAAMSLPTMPGNGVVEAPIPLPNDLGLRGVTLYTQWLTVEGSGPWALSTSNALRFTLR